MEPLIVKRETSGAGVYTLGYLFERLLNSRVQKEEKKRKKKKSEEQRRIKNTLLRYELIVEFSFLPSRGRIRDVYERLLSLSSDVFPSAIPTRNSVARRDKGEDPCTTFCRVTASVLIGNSRERRILNVN